MRRVHGGATLVWVALAVPSVLLWRESIAWVVFMSVYACITGHWSSYQAASAEMANGTSPGR